MQRALARTITFKISRRISDTYITRPRTQGLALAHQRKFSKISFQSVHQLLCTDSSAILGEPELSRILLDNFSDQAISQDIYQEMTGNDYSWEAYEESIDSPSQNQVARRSRGLSTCAGCRVPRLDDHNHSNHQQAARARIGCRTYTAVGQG